MGSGRHGMTGEDYDSQPAVAMKSRRGGCPTTEHINRQGRNTGAGPASVDSSDNNSEQRFNCRQVIRRMSTSAMKAVFFDKLDPTHLRQQHRNSSETTFLDGKARDLLQRTVTRLEASRPKQHKAVLRLHDLPRLRLTIPDTSEHARQKLPTLDPDPSSAMTSAPSGRTRPHSFSPHQTAASMQRDNSNQDAAAEFGINTNIAPSMGSSYVGNPISPFTAAFGSYGYNAIDAQLGAPEQDPNDPMGTTRDYMPPVGGGMNLYQPLPLNSTVYAQQDEDNGYQQQPSSQLQDMPSYASYFGVNGTPPYGTPPSELNTQYDDPEDVDYNPFDYHQLPRDYTRSSPSALYIHGFDSSTSQVPGSSETEYAEPAASIDADDSYQPFTSSAHKRKIAQRRARRSFHTTFTPPSSSASQTPPLQHAEELSPPRGSSRLIYNGFADAEAKAYNRSRLNIGGDDWNHIKNNPAEHVEKLVAAFDLPYGDMPEYHQLSDTDQERWISYQEAHMEKMSKFSPEQIEASCWVLLKNIIEAHEIGVKRLRYHRSDYIEKCSAHVERIAEAIALYAVIRFDVVRLQRFDELVSTTSSAIQRKISNFKGNWGKTKRELENDERAKEAGFEYKKVLGEKKRKVDDEAAPPRAKRRNTQKSSDLVQRIEATLEEGNGRRPAKKAKGKKT
ncbi:hypothetical protein AC578_4703 [Pseudocercospora eumusae]|uniref:Uncharacterized protein n=1 Tax=Pseudocercospora eumusae TaxID=321146 RepID=A0A139GYZ6_9PEZI|nr:hypothetical protein AC578_4703 [Pseudocercospora eumusae]